jgi:hypothetical protein
MTGTDTLIKEIELVMLVVDIRELTEKTIVSAKSLPSPGPYGQPDLEFQVMAITEMLKAVKIEVANAPVMIPDGYEQPIVMQTRRLGETEMVTIPKGCDTIYLYNWFTLADLMTQEKSQMIRLAFVGEGKQIT